MITLLKEMPMSLYVDRAVALPADPSHVTGPAPLRPDVQRSFLPLPPLETPLLAGAEPRVNGYDFARAALVDLKGSNTIDLVHDDRVIGVLAGLSPWVTRKLVKKHKELRLGYPTEESIDRALVELENESQLGPDIDSF
jgi:hypothetical protein